MQAVLSVVIFIAAICLCSAYDVSIGGVAHPDLVGTFPNGVEAGVANISGFNDGMNKAMSQLLKKEIIIFSRGSGSPQHKISDYTATKLRQKGFSSTYSAVIEFNNPISM